MRVMFRYDSVEDYRTFLKVKALPRSRFVGRTAEFPDEYAGLLGAAPPSPAGRYVGPSWAFDYQRDVAALAIRKRRFAVFMACGLGKTIVMLEFARHAHRELMPRGRKVLIVSPLMVVRQTLAEAVRFYGKAMPVEPVPAAALPAWLESPSTLIGITNYEAITDKVRAGKLGALVLDECFAKGTLVDVVEDGALVRKPIQDIQCGDQIINASGVDVVSEIHRRKVPHAVAITAGSRITCSPNHPFFTTRGWVCAEDLRPGDAIAQTGEAVRMVWDGLHAEEPVRGAEAVLRQILLSEMEDGPAGTQGEGAHRGDAREDRGGESSLVPVGLSGGAGREGEDQGGKQDVRSGRSPEGVRDSQGDAACAFRSGRQRDGADTGRTSSDGRLGAALGAVQCLAGSEDPGLPNSLQARLCPPGKENLHRGGRAVALQPEGAGREEGCQVGFTRVDRVEILEPGHPDLERLRDADGSLYFYDLGATRHPSFSVNGLLAHNSAMLKSHYGKWGQRLIALGKGLGWKLCLTGVPAPNDRIEYGNHAVFLDQHPTVNAFLARYFVNRGQTDNRWELKPHALRPFYRSLSHWCVFVTNPATYGWKDNTDNIPPIHVHIHEVPLTPEQRRMVTRAGGDLFGTPGGITSRATLGQLAKGRFKGEDVPTNKNEFIRDLIAGWQAEESTLVWCQFNREQEAVAAALPGCASIAGDTPHAERERLVADFQAGRSRVLVSKAKCLGLGLNLQVATRQVFSGLADSYEQYFQAVKRSNRVGSTKPLSVHIPVTEIERAMVENVMRKAKRVDADTAEQERLFKESGYDVLGSAYG